MLFLLPSAPLYGGDPAGFVPSSYSSDPETPDTVDVSALDRFPKPAFAPRILVKTNAAGWCLGVSNVAVEFDLCRHLSLTLPVYYSGINYFVSDVKFRTVTGQPELRCWFRGDNEGWFVGAHFGAGSFNTAYGGTFRYQDAGGRPALGGGLAGGWRMSLGPSQGWKVEFSLGVGAYDAVCDVFRNETNGYLVRTGRMTFVGVDQVSVAFAYAFGPGRKNNKGDGR